MDILLDFLRNNDTQHLYIVGDFIDGWALKNSWYWDDSYNVLIQKLLRKSRKHTQISYITGNHDEFLLQFTGNRFGTLTLAERAIHQAADGQRYLVIHGHQFDGLVHCNRSLEKLGSHLYDWILDLNLYLNRARRRLGFGYWSFASYLKLKAKSAVQYVTRYEEAMIEMAKRAEVDGIICGHIHRPEVRKLGDLTYLNCGDWVENCTALVEDFDGRIQLLRLSDPASRLPVQAPQKDDEEDFVRSAAHQGPSTVAL